MQKLPLEEVKARLKAVRKQMRHEGFDGLLVTETADVRYLCGHEHEAVQLLVTPRSQYLTTTHRGIQRAEERSVGFQIIDSKVQPGGFRPLIEKHSLKTLGVNSKMSHAQFLDLGKRLRPARLKPSTAVIRAREVKSSAEIVFLRKAQRIAEGIFETFLGEVKPGVTEFHLHNRLIQLILDNETVEGPSFEPVLSSGTSSWTFHSRYTDRKLRKNDCLIIDMGVRYRGYCSDMTRTIFLGKPTRQMREVYSIVQEAQLRAIDAIHAGAMGGDVADAAWGYIARKGYEQTHGLGHGLGLETHDYPLPGLSAVNKKPLQEKMVLTVEPGIYLENGFGVRIEDTVIVTRNGCENITRTPKELKVVG
ncbi:MAG: Xaa-Pro peptidase family protein [bacterium]|nr:Xaa-Pro peptidase family protein [bacterium]